MFIYSDQKEPFAAGGFNPYTSDGVKHYITHLKNYLYLQFVKNHKDTSPTINNRLSKNSASLIANAIFGSRFRNHNNVYQNYVRLSSLNSPSGIKTDTN